MCQVGDAFARNPFALLEMVGEILGHLSVALHWEDPATYARGLLVCRAWRDALYARCGGVRLGAIPQAAFLDPYFRSVRMSPRAWRESVWHIRRVAEAGVEHPLFFDEAWLLRDDSVRSNCWELNFYGVRSRPHITSVTGGLVRGGHNELYARVLRAASTYLSSWMEGKGFPDCGVCDMVMPSGAAQLAILVDAMVTACGVMPSVFALDIVRTITMSAHAPEAADLAAVLTIADALCPDETMGAALLPYFHPSWVPQLLYRDRAARRIRPWRPHLAKALRAYIETENMYPPRIAQQWLAQERFQ